MPAGERAGDGGAGGITDPSAGGIDADGRGEGFEGRLEGEVAAVVGQFDAESREDFEEQWRANQAFIWVWEMAVGAMAVFDAGTDGNEDFENDWSAATSI